MVVSVRQHVLEATPFQFTLPLYPICPTPGPPWHRRGCSPPPLSSLCRILHLPGSAQSVHLFLLFANVLETFHLNKFHSSVLLSFHNCLVFSPFILPKFLKTVFLRLFSHFYPCYGLHLDVPPKPHLLTGVALRRSLNHEGVILGSGLVH